MSRHESHNSVQADRKLGRIDNVGIEFTRAEIASLTGLYAYGLETARMTGVVPVGLGGINESVSRSVVEKLEAARTQAMRRTLPGKGVTLNAVLAG